MFKTPNNIESELTPPYVLNFDGCSKGNPGPSGAGAVIYHNDAEIWSGHQFVGSHSTNNQAEYNGLLLGLNQAITLGIKQLHVRGDSMLVIKQMRGEFKVNSPNVIELYNSAKKLERQFEKVTYEHVYRHNNTRADELSNTGVTLRLLSVLQQCDV